MVMTEVNLYKRTDGGNTNSMGVSEESGYGNLVKKCQALITSPHSKTFRVDLPDRFLTTLACWATRVQIYSPKEICQAHLRHCDPKLSMVPFPQLYYI